MGRVSEQKMATTQDEFGGTWTQQKLEALSKYLRAYTRIFTVNPRAQFYSITYVDAFAGTGSLHSSELAGFANLIPDLEKNDEEFRKGSALRALEVEPPSVSMYSSRRALRSARNYGRLPPAHRGEMCKSSMTTRMLRF